MGRSVNRPAAGPPRIFEVQDESDSFARSALAGVDHCCAGTRGGRRIHVSRECRRPDARRQAADLELPADAASGPRRPAARLQSEARQGSREDWSELCAYSAAEMQEMLQHEFDSRFEVSTTRHYLVVHPRGERDAMGRSIRRFVQSLRPLLPRSRLRASRAAVSAGGRRVSRQGRILPTRGSERHADAPEHAGPLRSDYEPRVPVRCDGREEQGRTGRRTRTRSSTRRRTRRRSTSASIADSRPSRAGWSKDWPRCSKRPACGAHDTTTRRPIA